MAWFDFLTKPIFGGNGKTVSAPVIDGDEELLLTIADTTRPGHTYTDGGITQVNPSASMHANLLSAIGNKEYQVVRDLYKRSPWANSAAKKLAKACISGGWKIVQDPDYIGRGQPKKAIKRKIQNLLNQVSPVGETFFSVLYRTCIHIAIRNEAAWEIEKDLSGEPFKVHFLKGSLLPNYLKNGRDLVPGSEYFHRYIDPALRGRIIQEIIPADKIVRFIILHPFDGLWGESCAESLNLAFTSELYADNWNIGFFERSAIPKGYWKIQAGASPVQKKLFKTAVVNSMQGPNKAQATPIVVEGDVTYEKISSTPMEADFVNLGEATREKILAVLGTPPTKLGIVKGVSRGAPEDQDKTFIEWEVRPIQKLLEDTVNLQLFKRFGWDGWLFKCKPASWLVTQQEAEVATKLVSYGIWALNEAREELFGGDPVPGGDEHIFFGSPPGPLPVRAIPGYGERLTGVPAEGAEKAFMSIIKLAVDRCGAETVESALRDIFTNKASVKDPAEHARKWMESCEQFNTQLKPALTYQEEGQ